MKGCASKKNRRNAAGCTKCAKLHKTKQQSGWSCPCECHRIRGQRGGCGCSSGNVQTGGSMSGPLVGSPWRPNVWGWPSVDGISGDRNYLDYNNYHVDPQTQVIPHNFNTGYSGGSVSRRNRRGGWVYKTSTSSNDESKDSEESSVNTNEEKESPTTTTTTTGKKIKKPVGKGVVGKGVVGKGLKKSRSASRRRHRYRHKSSKINKNKLGGGLIPQDLVNIASDLQFNTGSAYNALNGYASPVNPAPYLGQMSQNPKLM